jgi:hypothetical protein
MARPGAGEPSIPFWLQKGARIQNASPFLPLDVSITKSYYGSVSFSSNTIGDFGSYYPFPICNWQAVNSGWAHDGSIITFDDLQRMVVDRNLEMSLE